MTFYVHLSFRIDGTLSDVIYEIQKSKRNSRPFWNRIELGFIFIIDWAYGIFIKQRRQSPAFHMRQFSSSPHKIPQTSGELISSESLLLRTGDLQSENPQRVISITNENLLYWFYLKILHGSCPPLLISLAIRDYWRTKKWGSPPASSILSLMLTSGWVTSPVFTLRFYPCDLKPHATSFPTIAAKNHMTLHQVKEFGYG